MANKPHAAASHTPAKQHLPDRHPNNEEPKVNHLGRVRELVGQLENTSPSGANTLMQKIIEHLDAHEDPTAYDERQAEARKQFETEDAERQKNAKDRGEVRGGEGEKKTA